jgi:RNA polymerase sigma-70 factor (ECF subfamily)
MNNNSDSAQFEQYYHEYKDKIFTYLMYRVSLDRDVAEDLLMEIFLKAYERFDQFDESKGSFKSWIFAVTRNHLLNFYRDRKPVGSLEVLEEDGFVVQAKDDVQMKVGVEVEKDNIQEALQHLDEEEREVIIMRFINELSIHEISLFINKTEGATRTFLSRAMNNLRNTYHRLFLIKDHE